MVSTSTYQRVVMVLVAITTGIINYHGFRHVQVTVSQQQQEHHGNTGGPMDPLQAGINQVTQQHYQKRRLAAPIQQQTTKAQRQRQQQQPKQPASSVTPITKPIRASTKEKQEPRLAALDTLQEPKTGHSSDVTSNVRKQVQVQETPAKLDDQQIEQVPAAAVDVKTQDTTKMPLDHSKMVVDIISVGSRFLPGLQKAQQETFGSHPNVRIFYAAQEADDVDPGCHKKVTNDIVVQVSRFCLREQPPEEGDHPVRKKKREELRQQVKYPWLFDIQRHFAVEQKLLEKANPPGWLCAQKRPISALAKLVRRYAKEQLELPDYLFIIDDDTYINMDNVLTHLQQENPPNQLNAVAGCLYSMRDENMSLPYGGFGTVLSKESLRHAVRPLQCKNLDRSKKDGRIVRRKSPMPSSVDDYERFACERLQENRVNELHLFQPGMHVIELFEAYAKHQLFRNVANWSETGFCFHSDTFIGYLVNTYEIGRKDLENEVTKLVPVNHFQTYDDSVFYYGFGARRKDKTGNRCFHVKEACDVDSHICHYVPPHRMQGIYRRTMLGQTERGVYPWLKPGEQEPELDQ